MFSNSYQKIQAEIRSRNKEDNSVCRNENVHSVQYVYHLKSPDFVGTWIIPLNKMPLHPQFDTAYKQVYESAKAKYIGRESMVELTWPALNNCKWNDVNFLSPLHPNYIYEEFQKLGIPVEEKFSYHFKIPISQLDLSPSKSIIWTFPTASNNPATAFPPDSFCQINKDTYKELDGLPEKTKQYYKEEFSKTNKRPLMFFYVPHVLTTEPIEITKDVTVVHWKNPRTG